MLIVGFDDLECPFCAKMHAQMFPALMERYKDQVHIVYRDFPLDQHPWAMRAAIDANCVARRARTGYWNLVDYIHAHAGEMGGDDEEPGQGERDAGYAGARRGQAAEGRTPTALNACIAKQDDTAVKASMKQGEALGVDATPALFINGEKLEGAQPMEYVYRMIDNALMASGPDTATAAATRHSDSVRTLTTTPAKKPGN